MTSTDEQLLEVAEAIVIRPGDTLVIRSAVALDAQSAERARERALAFLPDLADVLIVCCDQLAVYRPDETEEAK